MRCTNCHAGSDVGRVPVLLAKSVIPGPNAGSLDAYRIEELVMGFLPNDSEVGI